MKKFFAKLHLWLAVPFGLVVSLLCLTGAILVFESEIKEWTQPSLYKASENSGQVLPFPELMERVKAQLPDTVGISHIQVTSSAGKNYRLGMAGERRTSILVDPYDGEVKGIVRPYQKGSFFAFVRKFHRWFLMEFKRDGISWGKMITGVTTLVFVFVIITGIVIWVPKTLKGLKKRLSIKRGAGRFRLWYDFHLSTGIITSLLLLVMALTGLTWSFTWYRNGFYKVFGIEIVQQAGGHGVSKGQGTKSRPQSADSDPGEQAKETENTDQLEGGVRPGTATDRPDEKASERGAGDEQEGRRGGGGRPEGREGNSGEGGGNRGGRSQGAVDYAVWEKAVETLKADNQNFRAITVQDGSVSIAKNTTGNTRASDIYTFDMRTGDITGVSYYKDQPKSAKIRGWIYAVHVGSWGGMVTKVIYFIACLIGTALPLTGYYIWLKKRLKRWTKNRETAAI